MDERYLAYELAAAGKMVRQLISHGANVNTADAYGRTPLMMAAMQNWPEAVRALLDAHASVDARDHAGHTVLDFVDPEERQLVRILTAAGAPPPLVIRRDWFATPSALWTNSATTCRLRTA